MYWLFALLPVLIVGFWLALCAIIAWLGGWARLADRYRLWTTFEGTRFGGQSAALGWTSYGGVLTFGVDGRGLYLAVFPLFRFAHPPLFVPWSDVSAHEVRGRWLRSVEFRFAQCPELRLSIARSLADRLLTLAPRAFCVT